MQQNQFFLSWHLAPETASAATGKQAILKIQKKEGGISYVTLAYNVKVPVPAAPVTVNYVDDDGGGIADLLTLNGNVGSPYQSEAASINGWALKETPANASGTFTEDAQEVVYVYERTEAAPTKSSESSKEPNKETLKNKETLPQTGEQTLAWVSVVGAILISVVGYAFYKRKG